MSTPSESTRLVVFDGICTTAMNAFFVGPFLAAFALALGASHWEIGLLSAIAFLSMPMQLAGLYAVDRWKRRRRLVVLCALTARLLWILIVCVPFFPEKDSVRFLLVVLVYSGLIAASPDPAWQSLVRSLLPVDSLGKVFSKRLAWGTVISLTLTLGGGFFVDAWPNVTGRPPPWRRTRHYSSSESCSGSWAFASSRSCPNRPWRVSARNPSCLDVASASRCRFSLAARLHRLFEFRHQPGHALLWRSSCWSVGYCRREQ